MSDPLKVVFCWHMHQPAYRSPQGDYYLPWTYLHGIKDYVDMAAHLEAIPGACAVVNFAPTLLEQLHDYVQQIQNYLSLHTALPPLVNESKAESSQSQNASDLIRDPLLAALVSQPPHLPFLRDNKECLARSLLVKQCLRANKDHMIKAFEAYQQLVDIADWLQQHPQMTLYASEQYLADLVVWYHLAWLGESARRQDQRVAPLMAKKRGFTFQDRLQLMSIMGDLLSGVIPRYAALCARGQVELSFTPYAHPIAPLLIDVNTARESLPHTELPQMSSSADEGRSRVNWHIQHGIAAIKKYFGVTPFGCWPAEGGISEEVTRLVEKFDIRWIASGENVLRNSLRKCHQESHTTHRPYHLPESSTYCFFRDDHLSDLIGFEYAKWHADDAVANFVHQLEKIAQSAPQTGAQVVSIILDGENAWETYPFNGFYFLRGLYQKLAHHPQLKLSTFSRCLELPATELPTLVAGSWVYGTFSTWIGDKDKNRGWQMLDDVKRAFNRALPKLNSKQRVAAEHQLAICEGSDWCWWFGDYNPSDAVRDFDYLYRLHLTDLYHLLDEPPPDYLQEAFSHGGGQPAVGGVMRRGQERYPYHS
jgi:alpha-amylase/alpha-mannosidase (GH57 family)